MLRVKKTRLKHSESPLLTEKQLTQQYIKHFGGVPSKTVLQSDKSDSDSLEQPWFLNVVPSTTTYGAAHEVK